MQTIITPQVINAGLSYPDFRHLVRSLLAEGKATGAMQSKFLIELSQSNLLRMDKAESLPLNPALTESLQNLPRRWVWLLINEGWCTDAAHHVPVIGNLAACSGHIDLRIILRSDFPEAMDAYLTNGGRSIPKLICLDADTLTELGTWGPRPAQAQELALRLKKQEHRHINEIIQLMDEWAEQDKGQSLQAELLELAEQWKQR